MCGTLEGTNIAEGKSDGCIIIGQTNFVQICIYICIYIVRMEKPATFRVDQNDIFRKCCILHNEHVLFNVAFMFGGCYNLRFWSHNARVPKLLN